MVFSNAILTSPFLVARCLCSVSRVLRFLPVPPKVSSLYSHCRNRARVDVGLSVGISVTVCDSLDSLQDETDYLSNVFSENNYNTDFVRRRTHNNTDSNTQTLLRQRLKSIPYIRGISKTIARTLLQYTCCTQTDNHFKTTTYKCQGQRQTGGQTGSSIQDQMPRLPGYLH